MEEFIKVKCPNCNAILIIQRHTEKIIEVRLPLVEKSSGDRFKDAFEKYKSDKNEAEKKFKETLESEKDKKKKLDEFLKKRLDEIKDDHS